MLTYKQLEDVSNNSVSWNLKDAAQTALALADMLKRLEWIEVGERDGEDGMIPAKLCPSCDNWKEEGHKPDCELAALLKKVRLNTMPKAILELKMPENCGECPLKEKKEVE